MDKYFAAYERYDMKLIDRLCESDAVKGVILGDLLCNKRMFDGGISELVLLMHRLLSSDKTAIFQAPLYVTSRNIDEVSSILRLMNGFKKDSFVIVQDFGTAELISREFENLRMVWGQMGRVREHRYSDEFLRFIREKQFYGMETGDEALAKKLPAFGLIPFLTDAILEYQTVGRICYLEYETGFCDPELCHKGGYSLKVENEAFEMTVDGYMLGKKYKRVPESVIEEIRCITAAELICRA